jgi:hypothetical protein
VTEYAEGDEEMTVKDINGASYKIPVPTGDCGETIASLWYDRGKSKIEKIRLIKLY